MPKDGSHIEHSLFPGVCSDSWFAEVLASGVSSIISTGIVNKRFEEG